MLACCLCLVEATHFTDVDLKDLALCHRRNRCLASVHPLSVDEHVTCATLALFALEGNKGIGLRSKKGGEKGERKGSEQRGGRNVIRRQEHCACSVNSNSNDTMQIAAGAGDCAEPALRCSESTRASP